MGLFTHPHAELMSHHEDQALLELTQRIPLGKPLKVSVRLGNSWRLIRVRPDRLDPSEPGRFLCHCTLLEPHQIPSFVEQRKSPRLAAELRVTSRELPGQQAVSLDLSLTGMCLEVEGSVEVEEIVEVVIPSSALGDELRLVASVNWCRQVQDRYRVGLKFERMEKGTRAALVALHRRLETSP